MSRNIDQIIGNNLKNVLKARDILPREISKKMKIATSSVYSWLAGTNQIPIKKLQKISNILDLDFKMFLDQNLKIKKEVKIMIEKTQND